MIQIKLTFTIIEFMFQKIKNSTNKKCSFLDRDPTTISDQIRLSFIQIENKQALIL